MHIYRSQQPLVCTLPQGEQPTDLATLAASDLSSAYTTADDTLSRLAAAAVKRQQYSQALQLLNQLIERHPDRAMYYSNRGLVYLWLGRPYVALLDCDRAVALGPNLDQAYNNRAMCHAALGDLAAALDDYEQAVDLNPFNSRARINLGATLRQMGALELALDCFDEALMFHQLPEFIYAERGRTYHLRGDWNCAIADYRRALAAAQGSAHCSSPLVERVNRWMAELLPQPSRA
ncbi:tetratricopeptide repeat protein [Nodosilinea sp. LEGE 06152]|uniref:tetratricopeptide repeat protein n=1 Tax=Nodosilinea sp. LEGE 06152 TaxID=2777966 RepID=UPI001880061D|nr:tetratricopeptide repeat protein [Nodosilinea sp. LEGE 06152]MBE9156749.1 tetratricopeptide repeat protein [Nodosilinea sp. LEGE 06152]